LNTQKASGFQRHDINGFVYYTRAEDIWQAARDERRARRAAARDAARGGGNSGGSGTDTEPDAGAGGAAPRAPVLFMHGVSVGILPYLGLLLSFASTGAPRAPRPRPDAPCPRRAAAPLALPGCGALRPCGPALAPAASLPAKRASPHPKPRPASRRPHAAAPRPPARRA
jgi:hypothetical protein